jgi:hypothetical protein
LDIWGRELEEGHERLAPYWIQDIHSGPVSWRAGQEGILLLSLVSSLCLSRFSLNWLEAPRLSIHNTPPHTPHKPKKQIWHLLETQSLLWENEELHSCC